MIHLYIGEGKGKTTAALGCALRASGWGKRVYFAQFLKDINYPCGEIKALSQSGLNIKIERFSGQIHPLFLKKQKLGIKEIKRSVKKSLEKIEHFIKGRSFDVIILDEVLDALSAGLLAQKALVDVLKKTKDIEIILTGRTASSRLMRMADYISFIGKIKHPFDRKVLARRSIEY